jgi:hypothetical protein
MPDFSSTIPFTYRNVSNDFIDSLIETQHEKLFTGLMHLQYPSGENLIFTFWDGKQQKLYRSREESFEVIPPQFWPSYLDYPDASVGLLALPLEGLRFMRVVHEAPIIAREQANLSVNDLFNSAEKWMADKSPSILHVEGQPLNKLYLVAGNSTPIVEELTLNEEEAHFSINGASFASSFPAREYQVSRFLSDNKYDVWQENELRFAFSALMRILITRFSELAGRVLTERLCEQLTEWTSEAGWKISITTNGLSNHHYFETLEAARDAYLKIVRNFNNLASPAIGQRMALSLAHDILRKLNPYHRSLLQRHVYELYDVDNAAIWAGGIQP